MRVLLELVDVLSSFMICDLLSLSLSIYTITPVYIKIVTTHKQLKSYLAFTPVLCPINSTHVTISSYLLGSLG